MDKNTVLLFTRNGLGQGPEALQGQLAYKFLALLLEARQFPAQILFYTDGVKLACKGSPVLEPLRQMAAEEVELVLCKTCLDYFGLMAEVEVGVVGGMTDIIEALAKAPKVLSL